MRVAWLGHRSMSTLDLRLARQAQTAAGEAHRRPAKSALAKAIRSLRKFDGRLRSRKAKRVIPADILGGLQTTAAQIRADVVALRRNLLDAQGVETTDAAGRRDDESR